MKPHDSHVNIICWTIHSHFLTKVCLYIIYSHNPTRPSYSHNPLMLCHVINYRNYLLEYAIHHFHFHDLIKVTLHDSHMNKICSRYATQSILYEQVAWCNSHTLVVWSSYTMWVLYLQYIFMYITDAAPCNPYWRLSQE